MKSGSLNCLKYLVFFFNLLIFICGIAALSVGIWAVVNEESFKKILVDSSWMLNGVYIIIAVGAALFLIGFMGCCGAIKENRCMLGTFFVIILVLFIAQLGGAIFIYVKKGTVTNAVTKSIGKYGDNTKDGTLVKEGWDSAQRLMKCCGVNGYKDWTANSAWSKRNPGKSVPASCCVLEGKSGRPKSSIQCQNGDDKYLYKGGCRQKFSKYLNIVVIIAVVILVVEILAMIFSCCLYKHANDYGELA